MFGAENLFFKISLNYASKYKCSLVLAIISVAMKCIFITPNMDRRTCKIALNFLIFVVLHLSTDINHVPP